MKLVAYISIIAATAGSTLAQAQSELSCLVGGEYLPVLEVRNSQPYCFTGDALIRGSKKNLTLLPTSGFAEGYAKIEIKRHERAGVMKQGGVLTFASTSEWYLLVATVTPDRDMNDCFFALGFDTYGKKSYLVRSLGDLRAGESRAIRVYVKLKYEMPDQLHLFSGMEEVRTSLVPTHYSYENGHLMLASN